MKRPRPYGNRGPSYGRGPNAAAYDRLTAAETNKAGWYPSPGAYLAAVRKADAITAAGGTVRTGWANAFLDAAGWKAEKRRALHGRINAKGGNRYSRYNDPHTRVDSLHIGFTRDARALRDFRERRLVRTGSGFETDAFRERFPEVQARFTERWAA